MTHGLDRLHQADRPGDNRTEQQRDRDRILYTTAFRRLEGVTQVASASETFVFHNRLTHTLEVAQIARRLAEHLQNQDPAASEQLELTPDLAEAAALAHDLGHPPFGHIGEQELNACVMRAGNADGFEGNAQSFRILCKLAIRHEEFRGLNLTRGTLAGVLKYPWHRSTSGKRHAKYGAYRDEELEFEWARDGQRKDVPTLAAAVMDWADDIAYSVHDLYDFFRAGLIPLDRLATDERAFEGFADALIKHWGTKDSPPQLSKDQLMTVRERILSLFPLDGPFDGTREHRAKLRTFTGVLISRYVKGTGDDEAAPVRIEPGPGDSYLRRHPPADEEVTVLKQLTAHYVIRNPALATIQHGQRLVVRQVFRALLKDASGMEKLLPVGGRELLADELQNLKKPETKKATVARVVADVISGMTERQLLHLHGRLMGHVPGSVLEPLP